ncbi:glycosyltransferase [Chitinophaga agrisoli]|uniref:Glycosyltransferase n=1 Tax=Chitinophaga agrisoli TaxID=2607653 RepID=A0A5B2VV81_9BACT|nr:glycosyltransferase family 2 protein [Chitinophaga agrisoli]KAA2242570.1 glycosyltransferase [Chitinophaga agrisoli]
MKLSIDVVIPSFRLDEQYILPILRLRKPANAHIKFYLVADNPAIVPSAAIQSLVDNEQVFLSINPKNMGASLTRNAGINMGQGEWVLFLDDDIAVPEDLLATYADAAAQHAEEIGFIGLVHLPEPHTAFTRALKVSGSLDIFSIAEKKPAFAWGATANIMIKRSAMGDVRFSTVYPKSGGGEDVDFFLKIRERNDFRDFKTLPQAAVVHPWWNNEQVNLQRPFRYGTGNSWLGELNPLYTYYDFFNTPETLLLCLIATVALAFIQPMWIVPVLLFMAGAIVIELIASAVQTVKRYPTGNVIVMMYVMALRLVHETGVLWGKLSRWKLHRIGERFHDNGIISRVRFYRSNTYKTVKWILYPLLAFLILHFYA